jgi:hypothetical protein
MSKIEVNEIDAQSGTTITVGSACKSVAVPGNVVKTNAVQASDGGNIVSQSGTTITLGASGDTVSLASGASQSGFGRAGSVDWQTGSIKTSTFTAADGEGYFVDTSSGAVTVNLPAGSAGAIVAFSDYTRTFQTNNLTITPNGSNKIGGNSGNATLSTEGQTATFVFVDSTEGWINTQETSNSVAGRSFISATGGTITTSSDCKIHTFTGPGTFCVSTISTVAAENVVSYMVIAGGAAGGGLGGGGAGGFREVKSPLTPYTASPLDGYPTSGNRVTITATGFPITVGAGGSGSCGGTGASGSNSIFSTITSAGGGGGGNSADPFAGGSGGSGGGGASTDGGGADGGSGNTPSVSPPQGNSGGNSGGPSPGSQFRGSGGGGAGSAGISESAPGNGSGGGNGVTSNITGSPVTRTGGGAGGTYKFGATGSVGTGGPGGGGNGGGPGGACSSTSGTVNTGSGGGGRGLTPSGHGAGNSGSGGSGIVVIRYKFQ